MRRVAVVASALMMFVVVGCGSSAVPVGDTGGNPDEGTVTPDGGGQNDRVVPQPDRAVDQGGTPDMPEPVDVPVTSDVPVPPPDQPVPTDRNTADLSANCDPLNLGNAPSVPLEEATITPAGQGGTLSSSTWVLQTAKYQIDLPIPVTGTVQGMIEFTAADAVQGTARVAIHGDISSPVQTPFYQTGAGTYLTSGNTVNIEGQCGGMSPIMNAQYTATATEITLWATTQVMGFDVDLELHLVPAQ